MASMSLGSDIGHDDISTSEENWPPVVVSVSPLVEDVVLDE